MTGTFSRKLRETAGVFGSLVLSAAACWAEPEAVLTSGRRIASADLVAYDSSRSLRGVTLSVDGTKQQVEGLVRWGEPEPAQRRATLVLTDGSRVLSDRTWSPAGLVLVEEERVRLRRGRGWFETARESVRWALLDTIENGLPLDTLPREGSQEFDEVWLANGDRLTGSVVSLNGKQLELEVHGQTLSTPLSAVAAIRFAITNDTPSQPACLVGLADGSLIRAERLRVAEGRLWVETLGGAELTGMQDQLVLAQPLGGAVRYLSDLEPVDYQHTPYLDLAWPYQRDDGLRGGPLVGGGSRRAKGLAIHSAARLIYRLDGSAQRFRAELAVGDPPPGSASRGSVVFRVYLVLEGEFASVYESPIVRSGEAPVPIDLDTTGAAAIALVVDYADGGDAGDEALWLDARLVGEP